MKTRALLLVLLVATLLAGVSGVQRARAFPYLAVSIFTVLGSDFFPGSLTTFTIEYYYFGQSQARVTNLEVSTDFATFKSSNSFPVYFNSFQSQDLGFKARIPTTATPGVHSFLLSANYDEYDSYSNRWATPVESPSTYRDSFVLNPAPLGAPPNPNPSPSSNPGTGNPNAPRQQDSFPWIPVIIAVVAVAALGLFIMNKKGMLGAGTSSSRPYSSNIPAQDVRTASVFCSNCGKPNPVTSKFCEFCGTPT